MALAGHLVFSADFILDTVQTPKYEAELYDGIAQYRRKTAHHFNHQENDSSTYRTPYPCRITPYTAFLVSSAIP